MPITLATLNKKHRISPFWILLELRMMEVVSSDNWNYDMQSQVTNKTNTQLFTARMPFLLSN